MPSFNKNPQNGIHMPVALLNIDNGLFLCSNNKWTVDARTALKFAEVHEVCDAAKAINVKHAVAAFLSDQGTARGFFWPEEPISN
jgi:hypothetical protein